MKKTKILCTLGPSSSKRDMIAQMIQAGMNAARINTAFGDIDSYRRIIRNIRSPQVRAYEDIPILIDLKGPEIRLICKAGIKVCKDQAINVGFNPDNEFYFNRRIYSELKCGDLVMLNKGRIKSTVIGKNHGKILLKIHESFVTKDGMGANVPSRRFKIPSLSPRDLKAIRMAREMQVDYVALSFTRDVDDVLALKRQLKGSSIGIIAKIENMEGVQNIDEILEECDGIMVARGDLGIEVPSERIPLLQKKLIECTNRKGKISIVATEMLQSMVENPQPTRAETSDVANAILDGADVVMLSAESAVGKHPLEAVRTLSRIANEVEPHIKPNSIVEKARDKVSLSIARGCISIVNTVDIDKIVVATSTGYTAHFLSNFRLSQDIIAITTNSAIRRKLHLVYGVYPLEHSRFYKKERVLEIGKFCLKKGVVKQKDTILFTAGFYSVSPKTNMLMVQNIGDLMKYDRRRNKRNR